MKIKKLCSIYVLMALIATLFNGCKKDSEPPFAVLTTTLNKITQSTATFSCDLFNNDVAKTSETGFCWSTNHNPLISDNYVTVESYLDQFTYTIPGFAPNVTYYVRSYATNSKGVAYGNEQSFTLWMNTPGPTFTDIDGNNYTSVKIGTQIWMVQNLRTTKYRNGDLIGTTSPDTLDLRSENAPKCQWIYKGYDDKVAIYGRLYTWYAVSDSRNIAPSGWHVPSSSEWATLIDYLDEQFIPGAKLKETGTTHWITPNTSANNSSGFTALPGGWREVSGAFNFIKYDGFWWSNNESSAVEAWGLRMFYDSSDSYSTSIMKKYGFSVRCLKDN